MATGTKSYQQEVFSLVAELSGTQNIIAMPRMFCKLVGSLEGGMFLSQLIYWADKGKGEWFYKSYQEWYEECFLTEYQVRKLAKEFLATGFLETKLKKANGSPTLHYRVDKSKLSEWILKNSRIESEKFQNGIFEIADSITEITTKTTTKITTKSVADATPTTEQQEWFGVVCAIVGWDYQTLGAREKAQVAQTLGIIRKAGYSLDELKQFLPKVWHRDWRWTKNGSHPTLSQLKTEIGKVRRSTFVPASIPQAGSQYDVYAQYTNTL